MCRIGVPEATRSAEAACPRGMTRVRHLFFPRHTICCIIVGTGSVDAAWPALAVRIRSETAPVGAGAASSIRAGVDGSGSTHLNAMTPSLRAGFKVLVVDDDPSVLKCYRRLLCRAGYTTVASQTRPGRFVNLGWTTEQ